MTYDHKVIIIRGGSRAAATSKMECSVIIGNGLQPLTIITKRSILDVASALDPSLIIVEIVMLLIFIFFFNVSNLILSSFIDPFIT